MLCMYKIPTKHPSKCLQTIKSKANSKHILNKWLLNYMSLDLFSHFAKCSIFSFFFLFLFKHSLFPQKFLSVVDLSLALWRNRIKLVFPCFYRNQLTFIFFFSPIAWILRNRSNLFVFLSFFTGTHVFQPRKWHSFCKCFIFFLIRTGFPFSKTLICSILSRKWKWMLSTKILQDNIKFHQNHLCSSCLNSMAFSILLRNKS